MSLFHVLCHIFNILSTVIHKAWWKQIRNEVLCQAVEDECFGNWRVMLFVGGRDAYRMRKNAAGRWEDVSCADVLRGRGSKFYAVMSLQKPEM